MRKRWSGLLVGLALAAVVVAAGIIPSAEAQAPAPKAWFATQAGTATQVISIVGTGGSTAWLLPWEKRGGTWVAIGGGTSAKVGPKGISAAYKESVPYTPAGVFPLPSAFGRKVNPGTKLLYRTITTNDWWVSDATSGQYNTYQRCAPGTCPFKESAGETSAGRAPPTTTPRSWASTSSVSRTRGRAYFLHVSNGKPTAGCVAVLPGTMANLLRWLRPGALIALKPTDPASRSACLRPPR